MKVSELIAKLQEAPEDAEVWLIGYPTGGASFGYFGPDDTPVELHEFED